MLFSIKLFLLLFSIKKPILLIPGLGASKLLKVKIDIWPPKLPYFLINRDKWIDTMINDKTLHTLEFGNKKSLDLHTNIPFIVSKNVYDNIIDHPNVYPIPYDFRLIHNDIYLEDFYNRLKLYIETFQEPIILLTHSSGGLLAHYFLYKQPIEWTKKYINHIIHINVPFGGLIYTLDNLVRTSLLDILVSKKVLTSIGAYIINMPDSNIIKPILIVNGKEIIDYHKYFNLENLKQKLINKQMLKSFYHKTNVDTIILYTSNIKTPSIINIKNNNINIIYGLGDGVVPLSSLLHPITWNQSNLQIIHIPNYDHSTILFSKELNNLIC